MGTGRLRAWYENGQLVAVEVFGEASPSVFLQKAAEACGAAPEETTLRFIDARSGGEQARKVSLWRGAGSTALAWVADARPVLLVWSTAQMESLAAAHQTALDAPGVAAEAAEQAKADATRF